MLPQIRSRSIVRCQSSSLKVTLPPSTGKIAPVIHATFPLAQAAEAHRLMESSAHVGKIVLVAGKA